MKRQGEEREGEVKKENRRRRKKRQRGRKEREDEWRDTERETESCGTQPGPPEESLFTTLLSPLYLSRRPERDTERERRE